MKFVYYTDWSVVPESANILFHQGEKESVFLSLPWFDNLVNSTLDKQQTLLLACVVKEGDTLAILPLIANEDGHWESLSHSYGSFYSVLISEFIDRQATVTEVYTCLAAGLAELPFRSLRLKPVDDTDQKISAFQHAMENQGFSCYQGFRFYNWSLHLQGRNFEQYMSERPGRVRNTITRKQRKLSRDHHHEIRLYIDDDIAQGVKDYNTVYKASWKAYEQNVDLMHGLVHKLAEQRWLRLAVLYIDNQAAAAQLWFVVHEKASIFRLAYDEAWKSYSPGSILTEFLMEYVINTDKVNEIDFLTGNEAYKQDWMEIRKARHELVFANNAFTDKTSSTLIKRLKGFLKLLS